MDGKGNVPVDGGKLLQLRQKRLLSREALAALITIPGRTTPFAPRHLYNLEYGRTLAVHPRTFEALLMALKVTADEISPDGSPMKSDGKASMVKNIRGGRLKTTFQPSLGPADDAATDWISRLGRFLGSSVEIRWVRFEPTLIEEGPWVMSDKDAPFVVERHGKLAVDDDVGILCAPPHFEDDPVTLQIKTAKYSAVEILKVVGKDPVLVSGNALVVCSDTEELILHRRRAEVSRDYWDALHTFGGAYSPLYDHESLVDTARRETLEEARIAIDTSRIPNRLLIRERDIGFLSLALLGIGISKAAVENAKPNIEGSLVRVKFGDLEQRLTGTELWVPSAKAQILAWLALGALISHGAPARFGGGTGEELFDRVIGSPEFK